MSTNFDFNDAGEQRNLDVIPAGTICTVQLSIRPGGAGEGGWLKDSADGASKGLDCECTVVDGPYAKRKIWHRFTLEGTTQGHAEAGEISRNTLRAILESARGIRRDDKSEAAQAARKVTSWADFDGIRFVARLGVRPPKDGYRAKSTIDEVITPERKEWVKPEQVAKPAPSGGAPATATTSSAPPANAIARPQWAE
jgi:hypothetical protein